MKCLNNEFYTFHFQLKKYMLFGDTIWFIKFMWLQLHELIDTRASDLETSYEAVLQLMWALKWTTHTLFKHNLTFRHKKEETSTEYSRFAGYILVLMNGNILMINCKNCNRLQYLLSNPVSLSNDFQNCCCQHYKCQSPSLSDGGKPPVVWRRPTFLLALFTTMSFLTRFFIARCRIRITSPKIS